MFALWMMLAIRVILYIGAEATYRPHGTPLFDKSWGKEGTLKRDMYELFSPYWYYCDPREDSVFRVIAIYGFLFNINGLLSGYGIHIIPPLIMVLLYIFLKGSQGAFYFIELFVLCVGALGTGVIGSILFLVEEHFVLLAFRNLKRGW